MERNYLWGSNSSSHTGSTNLPECLNMEPYLAIWKEIYHWIMPWKWNHTIPWEWNHTMAMESYHTMGMESYHEMAQLSPRLTFLKREYHRLWEDILWYSAQRTCATKACLVQWSFTQIYWCLRKGWGSILITPLFSVYKIMTLLLLFVRLGG